METLRTVGGYSPFSALSSSPTTLDETYLYAAEVNYSYRQHRLAYDTDAYEHRNQPMPYSMLPTEAEVLLAKSFGSVDIAQIVCCFLFPAITAWLLMGLFLELDASIALAALLALITLIASFSIRTLEIGIRALLVHGLHSGFIETLQASRNPNPNMTFPLFLGALLAMAAGLQRRSTAYAALAGVLGGLLFYSYIYYAIAWAAASALFVLFALFRNRDVLKQALAGFFITVGLAVPFLFWVRAAGKAGAYLNRSNRLGMIHSHIPPAHDVKLSALFALSLLLLWLALRFFTGRTSQASPAASMSALVFGCAAAGGIAGMNMQVLTGSNVQASHHFPHMVIQPALILLLLIVLLSTTKQVRHGRPVLWAGILFAALFVLCAASQVEAAVNSAPLHRVAPSDQALFQWLNRNTRRGDVVATTSLHLAVLMPVYSQNYTLMVDGSRTSGTDSEVLDRYLLAEALASAPIETVAKDLGSTNGPERDPPWSSYPGFFFEHSSDLAGPSTLKPAVVQDALAEYRSLDPASDLKRFRVDYLFTKNGEAPAHIPGIEWQPVLATGDGILWRLQRR